MSQVNTIKGLIDRERLKVTDIVDEGSNHRSITTEWHLDGELVRRDAHVAILSGHTLAGDQAAI